MLSTGLTAELLDNLVLGTANQDVEGVIKSLLVMCHEDIAVLVARRDTALFAWDDAAVLSDERLEILSEITIDVDEKLARLV